MIIWYSQERETSCVAACIRMVLSDFGQQLAEKQIRKALSNPLFGITLAEAQQRLERAGVSAAFHEDWGLTDLRDCLRSGFHPIVGLERRFFGHTDSSHAIVLLAVDGSFITAFDPLGNSQPETIRTRTFEIAWDSAGRQALVIKSPFPQ